MTKNIYALILMLASVAIVYLGLGRYLRNSNNYKQNSDTGQTAVNNLEEKNISWLTAEQDVKYQSQSELSPSFSVTIPRGVSYYQQNEPLHLKTQTGLNITVCSTCQLFIPGCGGLTDGNPEEGGCAIEEVDLGSNLTLEKHYQTAKPQEILGYFQNLKNSEGDVVSVRITSEDNRALSEQEKEIVERIMASLE
jgi:hypothetical protein